MNTENTTSASPVISNKIYLKDVDFYMHGLSFEISNNGKSSPVIKNYGVKKIWYCDNPIVELVIVSGYTIPSLSEPASAMVHVIFKGCREKVFSSRLVEDALKMAEDYMDEGGIGDEADCSKIEKTMTRYLLYPYLYCEVNYR